MKLLTTLALCTSGFLGCDAPPVGDPVEGPTEGCSIAVVSSDYTSSSVSVVREDPGSGVTVCATDLLDSGSVAPGLVSALSGDVALATSQHPAGYLTIIDRFPNAVITLYDVDARSVVRQINVATGFASNPLDVAYLSPNKAYVSRNTSNPTPTDDTNDHDDGGDLLVFDPSSGSIVARIDLAPTASTDPRPTRMALSAGLVWVVLGNLARDFGSASDGELVGVDPDADAVVTRVSLAPLTNCGAVGVRGAGLVVSCSGLLLPSAGDQSERAGLAFVDLSTSPPVVEVVTARALGHGAPGFGLVVLADDQVAYTVLGRLEPQAADALYVIEGPDGIPERLAEAGPFELGGLTALSEGVLFADANPVQPQLGVAIRGLLTARFPLGDRALLPPRAIGHFR
ncbi:MAG: hypothetical protein ACI9MR_002319 [Myxococcota bacterium]|jgi:hypothetical protein